MEVSIAAAEAVKQANVDVISAYPITPQTHIVEHLSEIVANGISMQNSFAWNPSIRH